MKSLKELMIGKGGVKPSQQPQPTKAVAPVVIAKPLPGIPGIPAREAAKPELEPEALQLLIRLKTVANVKPLKEGETPIYHERDLAYECALKSFAICQAQVKNANAVLGKSLSVWNLK